MEITPEGLVGDPSGTLIERMGMTILEISATRTVATMPVEGNRQIRGLLHGGASAALAETVGSLAAAAHAGPEQVALGVDLNITHHRALAAGTVTAVATAAHLGRTSATHEVTIEDDEGRRVATARITCAIRPKPEGG